MYKKKKKKNIKIFSLIDSNKKKFLKKKIYINFDLKFLKKNLFNFTFKLNDINDRLFYVFFDVLTWDQKTKWFLFKPHYVSLFFRFKNYRKWLFVRLINLVNKNNLKKKMKQNIKNISIFFLWCKKNINIYQNKVTVYYQFKDKIILFKFKRYYFSHLIKKDNIIFDTKFFFNKYFNKIGNLVQIDFFFFFNYYFKLYQKINFLKKNNKIYLFFKYYYYFFLIENEKNFKWFKFYKIYVVFCYLKLKKKYFFYYIVEEKHKLKIFKIFWMIIYYKLFSKIIREALVFEKLISKKRFRRKKGEEKIVKMKNKKKRKKRTNKQILMQLIKNSMLSKNLVWNICNLFFINIYYKKINMYNSLFFIKKFFFYINELYIDMDCQYVRYLPRKRSVYYISLLNEDVSYLWKEPFKRSDNKNSTYLYDLDLIHVKVQDNFKNIKSYNKVTIKNIYKRLINYNNNTKKNSLFMIKNLIVYLRFLNFRKKYLFSENLDFIFNIYFWLIMFLKLLKKSNIIFLKKILNFASFLKIIKVLLDNNFNWFNINNFEVYLNILTLQNFIVKLSCNFNFLLQEICIYLYYNILNFKPKYYEQSLYYKLKELIKMQNIQYVFKGNLSFENNYIFCLYLINKNSKNIYFLNLIKNFFFYCELSLHFIKKYIKLYWILLELTYKVFDNYILNFINRFSLKKNFYYMRYKNIIIFYNNLDVKNLLYFILKNFIFFFLYYFLKFYFIYCTIINLNKQKFEFLNYIIFKENNIIKFKASLFSFIKLLFFYNFIQKKNNKLMLKSSHFLLNFSITGILNYFFNIWYEIYYYYNLVKVKEKNLKLFRDVLYKVCFLTIYIKLREKNKIFKFKDFKKIFRFQCNYNNKIINNKKLNNYIKTQNNLNLFKFINKFENKFKL